MGERDGVSLEIAKWKQVLIELGHRVHLCAGNLAEQTGTLIPEFNLHDEEVRLIQRNSFGVIRECVDEAELQERIYRMAAVIEKKMEVFIDGSGVDFLIVENIWSLGIHLPAAIAVWNVVESQQIPVLAHHHDFHWERPGYRQPTCNAVAEILDRFFPPRDPLVHHVVINRLAGRQLQRRSIEAKIIPNVFDFDSSAWKIDQFNRDLREAIEVNDDDILLLQATRIIPRKGIELAIDLVVELNRPHHWARLQERGLYDSRTIDDSTRIILVLPNLVEDEEYLALLQEKSAKNGVEVRFVSEIIGVERRNEPGRKIYSLWDTYAAADIVTYPSLQEGWGNQFLEALRAKLPIILFEYEVYTADIKPNGFDVISLGKTFSRNSRGLAEVSPRRLEEAADATVTVLTDSKRRRAMVDHNFALGRGHYSLEALKGHLHSALEAVIDS